MGSDFDPGVAEWHLTHRRFERSFEIQAREVLARLPEGPAPVLDLGCGSGPLLPLLRAAGHAAVGLDRSAEMLHAAARGGERATALADAAAIPLRDRSVKAVAALGLFEYLPDPVDALREVARVLRPGGVALLTVPRWEAPYRRALTAVAPVLRALGRTDPFDLASGRRVTRADADRWGSRAGLRLIGAAAIVPSLLPWPVDRLIPRVEAALAPRLAPDWGAMRLLRFERPGGTPDTILP